MVEFVVLLTKPLARIVEIDAMETVQALANNSPFRLLMRPWKYVEEVKLRDSVQFMSVKLQAVKTVAKRREQFCVALE